MVGMVLLFCILPLGDAINVGGSSSCRLPVARRLLTHPAQPGKVSDLNAAVIFNIKVSVPVSDSLSISIVSCTYNWRFDNCNSAGHGWKNG